MYIVIQRGLYRHDIVGCFSTLEKAKTVSEIASTRELDLYHDFEILEITVDEMCTKEKIVAVYSAFGRRGETRNWKEI